MKYKAVFFDFDGTLMDTSDGIIECGKYSMNAVGLEVKPGVDWKTFIGPPLEQCFTITHGVTDKEKLDKLCKVYRDYYHREALHKAKFYDGIPEVIEKLHNEGYKLGCASMKHDELVKKMLEYFGIGRFFDVVLGLDTEEKNTKAMLIRSGCLKLGIRPDQAVLVGDTEIDEKGANEAGCSMIRVDWGFGFKRGQEGTISQPSQILQLV